MWTCWHYIGLIWICSLAHGLGHIDMWSSVLDKLRIRTPYTDPYPKMGLGAWQTVVLERGYLDS